MIAKSKREELHKMLDQVEDQVHFDALEAMLLNILASQSGEVYYPSEAELEGIEQGLKDLKEGRTIPWDEIKKKHEKWLE